jgi:hypothetical protein
VPDRRFIENLLRPHRENQELLPSGQGERHPAATPEHENLRDPGYYHLRRKNVMSDNLLTKLKLPAMAGSLIRQRETPQTYGELSFEERLGLLVDESAKPLPPVILLPGSLG